MRTSSRTAGSVGQDAQISGNGSLHGYACFHTYHICTTVKCAFRLPRFHMSRCRGIRYASSIRVVRRLLTAIKFENQNPFVLQKLVSLEQSSSQTQKNKTPEEASQKRRIVIPSPTVPDQACSRPAPSEPAPQNTVSGREHVLQPPLEA